MKQKSIDGWKPRRRSREREQVVFLTFSEEVDLEIDRGSAKKEEEGHPVAYLKMPC